MWSSNRKTSNRSEPNMQEREAVTGVRDALARVIAECSHSDRSCAIEAIQAIDRAWHDEQEQYSITFRLAKVYDSRFSLLDSFSGNTDKLTADAPEQMHTALYAIDRLAGVLIASLVAVGVAVYPTANTPSGKVLELPRGERDTLMGTVGLDRDSRR